MKSPRKRPAGTPAQPSAQTANAVESGAVRPARRSVAVAVAGHSPFSPLAFAVAAGLVALDLAVYLQVRHHPFITLDDGQYVTKNAVVQQGLRWPGVAWAFTTGAAANWHPLTWLSHMLDVRLFGMWAGGHHLTSVAWHIANTLLLFFGLQWMTPVHDRSSLGRSAVVAALFGIHPMHAESVAWVSERKDVLSTFFWWLTIGAYVRYARRPGLGRMSLVVAALALGLMAKPMLVTVPVVLLLLDVWPLERIRQPFALSNWRPLLVEKLPLVGLSLISTIVTFVVQRGGGAVIRLEHLAFDRRLANAAMSYGRYLWKALWPAHLTIFYAYPVEIPIALVTLSVVALAAISAGVWRLRTRYPYLAVGWLWYLITLLPVIGIVQVGGQAMADRYSYVPIVGILVAVVWGLGDLAVRWRIPRAASIALGSVVILAYGAAGYAQVTHWTSSAALWQHAIDVMPENYVAYGALGAIREAEGKRPEALDLFTKATRAAPTNPAGHFDLADELIAVGRVDDAIAEYEVAIQLAPEYVDAHLSLGIALQQKGRIKEAIDQFRETVRLDPVLTPARMRLGMALEADGRLDEATVQFQEGLKIDPSDAALHYRLAGAYAAAAKPGDAMAELREAIRLQPGMAEAHADLGTLLFALNRSDEAIAE